ncbi:hypothetical protein CHS0354_008112 [Potamilus streckersoni]|uniref:Uncharacterized protein n=1 Tax=Potamilus streckersoni TaxID=2493646 RepID=A0AAE0W3S2_9BIVA|nr:hypothetical protein CHS0354_008112 [Potamilus streckersoni]
MGICTSKGTVIISSDRSDTFSNQTPVTYKLRGSDTNETNKQEPAAKIHTESNEHAGGTTRDGTHSTVAQSIDFATNENNERLEERNSKGRKIDIGTKTEITSLSKLDELKSQEVKGNGVDYEILFNEYGEPETMEKEMPDDNERAKGSLTFIVDQQEDVHKRDDNSFPPADTDKTNNKVEESEESYDSSDSEALPNKKKDEGKRNVEEQISTESDFYEDNQDHPGDKQRGEPDKTSKKKFNLIRNAVTFIQRPEIVQALVGKMDISVPSQSRIVRIFISSTFTDTKNERNMLMKKAYPKLKSFCQKLGYEFQVVDMRWGVRDTATDSQTGTELCLNEIKLCQTLSTGPSFVSLVSHKYGYRMLPRTIESKVFEQIMLEIQSKGNYDAIQYFKKWYRRDDNAVPPENVLANITFHYPDYFSSDKDSKNQSKRSYDHECEVMTNALEETEAGIEYSKSVTEVETRYGMVEVKEASKHCVWFQRTIEKIEDQQPSDILSKYMESGDPQNKWKRSRELLAKMKNKMTSTLVDDRIRKYTVHWDTSAGINPESAEHDKYLQTLADDFEKDLSTMIKDAVKECVPSDPVVEEVHRHIKFCKAKCETFSGRDDCLRKMEEYIVGQSTKPMIVYGVSGCGKTSLMAKGAYLSRQWTNDKAAVILRFIGTSQRSTTIKGLLQSLTQQIKRIYRTEVTDYENVKAIEKDFMQSLELANEDMPLILILDSLDQLDPANNARQLKWLPEKLSDHCKVILSTLPDENYQCYPILKNSIKNKNNFLEVKHIPKDDVKKVIKMWLQLRNRTLTPKQMDCVLEAYEKCSLPLFLKLSFEEAIRWNSFSDETDTVLKDTVKDSIDALFEKLELKHGTMLMSRALGYLTVSQNGITEAELEDVLSCDDDVLNDVYKFWTPPIRRLPPLLLVRLKTDLEQYLVERDADGSRVFYWYHRQFKETAEQKYCSKKETRDLLHTCLADFFSGLWANDHPKPFTYTAKNDQGQDEEKLVNEVRLVSAQPLNENNLRKLNNLPFHRLKAGQLLQLKKECLCNCMFLLMKLRATNLWSVMDDFALAKSEFPEDEAIKMIHDVLQISQDSLLCDPNQLPVQMILRLESNMAKENKDTKDFLAQCASSIPYLLPDKNVLLTPGGQLVHSMAGHKEYSFIYSVDVSIDGQYTVTCGDDETVRIWHNVDGRQDCMHKTECVQKTYFCLSDAYLLIFEEKKVVVKKRSGEERFIISLVAIFPWCLCGPRREYFVLFKENKATTYNLETLENMNPVECKKKISFSNCSTQLFKENSFLGSERYAVAFSIQKKTICLFDVSKQQFVLYHNVCQDSRIQKGDVHSLQWAITNNETCIAYTSSKSESIYFVDINTKQRLRELQVFKEKYNADLLDLRISRDKHYLTFLLSGDDDISTLVIYSLEELELLKRKGLRTSLTYASSSNGTTVVTSSEDALVQVWDLTRPEEEQSVIKANKVYKYLQCLPNSRYILGTYSEGSEDKHCTLFVYDICTQETVRHTKITTKVDVLLTGRDTAIVWPRMEESKIAYLVDLDKMSAVTNLSGLPPMNQCLIYGNGEGLISWTKEGQVNSYRLPSGENSPTLVIGRNCQLHVNRSGSVMTVNGQDTVDVYLNNKFLHSIKYQHFDVENFNGIQLITDDGNYIIFQVEREPPMCQNGREIKYFVVWDIKKGKMVSNLVDSEYYTKYEVDSNSGSLVNLVSAILLDNNRVLAAHDDYIMRLYDVKTGLSQRIEDSGRSKYLQTFEGAGSFLSYGYEEDAFWIWDKKTLTPVASFKSDYKIDNIMITMDGRYIIGIDKNQGIVKWKLMNGPGEDNDNPDSYPEDFPYQGDLDLRLDLGIEDKKKDEEATDDAEENKEEDFYSSDDELDQDTDDNEQNDQNIIQEDDERFHKGRESDTVKDGATGNVDTDSEKDHAIDNTLQSTEITNGKHDINNGNNEDEEALLSDPSSEDW